MDGIKDIKTVADLKAAFPDLTKQIEEAATDAERKRIQDIDDDAHASGAGDVGTGGQREGAGGDGPDEVDAAIDKLFPDVK